MLGRTAANLFWLSRYVERAENMARLLEVGYRMSLTARREGGASEHLVSMLQAAEMDEAFNAKHEVADVATVSHFMLFDEENPSSVRSCLLAARTNARSVRTALTRDVWETINAAWLEFSQIRPRDVTGARLQDVLQWVKQVSNQFRGAMTGTVLRGDGYMFSTIGGYVERADNTARILDMKYYVLLPRATLVGGDVDIQQWTLILRAASAHRSYRHVYHDRYKAANIADYLILRPEMPRSLRFCMIHINRSLDGLSEIYGTRQDCHLAAEEVTAMLVGNTMERIFQHGLHEFLTEFIARNNRVTETLSDSYNFY
ncbi:alpha-E domain-containing protein [Arsenicitalea aurantiaca]|uniref:Alpha-E domain-containing protein n=1 Tax=Arsenicitalea aurantiaca TaxID=1783274 RepID=A0A433XB02_9HYPH|nr:alpha-E domain-containing protein [Arsenicitalea aurantiaca]RUT31242.1 alpha-E domain-containing protein [Arsenicitalea aurantiaca]